jgi:hypothetical protein
MREAKCCCGSLSAVAKAEPQRVMICHCIECQRRTGSPFGAAGYFNCADVEVSGPSTVYVRQGTSGKKLECHFCPTCGSSVYWFAEFMPGIIGVAMGAFADPEFPAPTLSAWERSRHDWVTFAHDMLHLPQGRQS